MKRRKIIKNDWESHHKQFLEKKSYYDKEWESAYKQAMGGNIDISRLSQAMFNCNNIDLTILNHKNLK